MKKELRDKLTRMQANPTTGGAHNHQLITTQVETIFMLDELSTELKKLNRTIEESNIQSVKNEKASYKLQFIMLVFTAITPVVALFPLILQLATNIAKNAPIALVEVANSIVGANVVVGGIAALLSGIVAGISFAGWKKASTSYALKFDESIKIKDTFEATLRDKEGNIKEKRKG